MILSILLLAAAGCGIVKRDSTDGGTLSESGTENSPGDSGAYVPASGDTSDTDARGAAGEEDDSGSVTDSDGPAEDSDMQNPRQSGNKPDYKLLQSASIDLDNDGVNEQIGVVRTDLPMNEAGTESRAEGRLLISDGNNERQVVFFTKENDPSELLSRIEFEDLDGDGSTDIFMVIPGYGASFNYSSYFIYSYKKDKSHSFISDNTLADFIDGFEFSYAKGASLLTVANRFHNFSVDIVIEEAEEQESPEDIMQQYAQGTWIDPVSVDISEDSRLSLVKNKGLPEIKVPLPVFGMATVNMIAEIDLFYGIDSDFIPILKRCEIIDFSGSDKVKAGSFEVTAG